MKSWKTTLFGLMAALGAGAVTVDGLPTWAVTLARLSIALGLAGLGFFSRDNDKTSEQVGADKKGQQVPIKFGLLAVSALALTAGAGCAFNRQYATTTSTNPTNGVVSVTLARSTTMAVLDAKAIIDKTRASAGKTSSVGASGVNEDATTANLATNANALTGLINALKTP
jgi:hypothetical protein